MTTPSTGQLIDAIVDAIVDRITEHKAALGITKVTERDGMPTYVENGECFVIPLVEGKDVMRTPIGGGPLEHQFPVLIVGHYTEQTVEAGLRSTRNRGYDTLDLFFGSPEKEVVVGRVVQDDDVIGAVAAYPYDPVLEVGYARVTDYILHWFIVKLNLKTVI